MSIRYAAPAMTAVVALTVAMVAKPANSQSDIASGVQAKLAADAAKLERSCADEIKNFCSTVTPGEGRVILCVEAHEDKLSPKCTFAMHEAAKDMKVAADTLKDASSACRDDVGKLCAKTPVGQGRLMQCLTTNKASVSKACADNLQKLSDFAGK